MPRAETTFDAASDAVSAIITDVRTRGFTALTELAQRFDGVDQQEVRVPAAALDSALEQLDPAVRAALETAIDRTRTFAKAQCPADAEVEIRPGAVLTHKWVPVSRVGLYVPGGLAVYPSSVIMNVVPAQAAGVASLALASPPQKEFGGLPHPAILAAAKLLGITEVYAVGGAQAIAAFAYGVQADQENVAIAPVDVVTGPGNVFVATAKRLVKGVVGIDSEAGPTEIMVLADETADPRLVAADLVSQAEHDPNAGSVLVTASEALAEKVRAELGRQVADTRHSDRVRTALSGPQSGVILVDGLEQGIDVQVEVVRKLGMRAMLTRGSMTLGEDDGGLPPSSTTSTQSLPPAPGAGRAKSRWSGLVFCWVPMAEAYYGPAPPSCRPARRFNAPSAADTKAYRSSDASVTTTTPAHTWSYRARETAETIP